MEEYYDNLRTPKSPFGKKNSQKSIRTRRRLVKMFEKDRRCCYCKCRTAFYPSTTRPVPDNQATTEHIYQKWDIRRALSEETALACYKCNQEMDKKAKDYVWGDYDYRVFNIFKAEG